VLVGVTVIVGVGEGGVAYLITTKPGWPATLHPPVPFELI
jgi:hypothetical protein